MKTLVGVLLPLLFLFACGDSDSPPSVTPAPEQLIITSSPGDLGIFDPSVTRDPTTGRMWMSYSSVDTSPNYSSQVYWAVSIRLAYSDDNGVSWQDAGEIAPAVERTDFGPMASTTPSIPANSSGFWQNETSSLVYEPGALAGEEWKLIWFQYLHADQSSLFGDYSWIAMKMASTPQGLVAATPIKLFGGAGLQADNNNTATPLFSPIGTTPAIQLNTGITPTPGGPDPAELNWCIFLEPGLLATNSTLHMSMYCADASSIPATGGVTEYVVHFSCNSPCNITNAASWKYLGRLLTPRDAQADTGDHHFQAPALIEKSGKIYLTVTPVDTTAGDRYNGCRVYEFVDPNSNQLLRSAGQLVERTRVYGDADTHHGACDAYSGLEGGFLLSQLKTPGTEDMFSIYKSQVSLP